MNSYIEVNDADYKYILAKGGRVEQFSGIFNNNDSVESALKPIINDLKQSKGILIKFILSNEKEQRLIAYAGTIRTASRFTSGHSAGVDSDS